MVVATWRTCKPQLNCRSDGKEWVVNGSKTFISGGMKSDYFVVGVKTAVGDVSRGADMHGALSLLLLTKEMAGIKRTRLKTQGWWLMGTSASVFAMDNV